MSADVAEAKRLFQNGLFEQCKQTLLILHSKDPSNALVVHKLGEVCLKLEQLDNALKHYRKLLSLDSSALDTSYAKRLLDFGKLLLDNNKLDGASEFLQKSLQLQASGAAHKYLGLIHDKRFETDRAIYHFRIASEIQPNIALYHFQLAKCLQSAHRYDDATKSYERALELTEHQEAAILNEYSHFLYKCLNNRQLAWDFARLAASLDKRYSLTLKFDENDSPLSNASDKENQAVGVQSHSIIGMNNDTPKATTKKNIKYSSLKCIMYDFDSAIQYLSVAEHVSGNVHNLEMMFIEDFLIMFGRRDRINRLRNHFEKLQSIKIKIGLYIPRNDAPYRDLVIAALKRSYLYSYFEFIEDPYSIHGVAKRFRLKEDELLLVSDRGDYLCPKRFGLSLHDLECIESNLGFDMKMHTTFACDAFTPSFLSLRNFKLYRELRMEILRHHFHDSKGVHSLEAIGWIKQSPAELPVLDMWIEYASKLLFMIYCSHTHRLWTALALLDVLMEVEPEDPELRAQKPVFLASIGRPKEAEMAYRDCLRPPFIPRVLTDFGFFFYAQQRYHEAEEVFAHALRVNPVSVKANIGYGRTLDRTHRRKDAEYYFRKALAIDPGDPMAHIRYGGWLYWCKDDLEGALHHYKESMRYRPDSDKTVYFMSKIHREKGNMEMAKECLLQCLTLNPSHLKALADYRTYFGDPEKLELDRKSFVLSRKCGSIRKGKRRLFWNADDKEFCVFWVHRSEFFLNPDAKEFEKYYLEFKAKGLFLITRLFELDEKVLSEVIGITNQKHVRLIMECIDKYAITPYENLRDWVLKVVGDRRIGEEVTSALLKEGVYSLDSFGRILRSPGQLNAYLGAHRLIHARNIWNAFATDHPQHIPLQFI